MTRPDWLPAPLDALRTELYVNANTLEDIDSKVWTYLCELMPDGGPYRPRMKQMLDSLGPQLKVYFLTRGFDWQRGSGGLESCMMNEDDDLFLDDTIRSFEELGALEHAKIIRQLRPLCEQRMAELKASDLAGVEWDSDDEFFDEWEERWTQASDEFDFYDVIFSDMKKRPEQYTHPKMNS